MYVTVFKKFKQRKNKIISLNSFFFFFPPKVGSVNEVSNSSTGEEFQRKKTFSPDTNSDRKKQNGEKKY